MPISGAIKSDDDEDSYESDDSASEELTEQESIDLAAAQERALFRFAKLKKELSKEDFEAYAASRISALFRGRCVRYKIHDIKDIKREMSERFTEIMKRKNHLRLDKKALAFNMKSLTMSHSAWRNQTASMIQVWWRLTWQAIKARPTTLIITRNVGRDNNFRRRFTEIPNVWSTEI